MTDGPGGPPESGRQVGIDEDYNGQVTLGVFSTTTGSDGSYDFAAVPPGEIMVRLVPPVGWSPVDPSTGSRAITVSASQSYTNENFVVAPIVSVTGVSRAGAGRNTTIDLSFSGPLNVADASNSANYRLTLIAQPDFPGSTVTVFIPIRKVIYNPTNGTAILKPRYPFALSRRIEVEIMGSGMSSVGGVLLDGSGEGNPGSNFMAKLAPRSQRPTLARAAVSPVVPGWRPRIRADRGIPERQRNETGTIEPQSSKS